MADLKKLHEQRGKAIADARAVVKASEEAGHKDLSAEDQETFDKHMDDAEKLRSQIERETRLAKFEKEMADVPEEDRAIEFADDAPLPKDDEEQKRCELFRSWLQDGREGMLASEHRDLSASVLTSGGSFIPPVEWVNKLIKAVDNQTFFRQISTTMTLNGSHSLGVPTLEADPSAPVWTNEVPAADPTADATMATGGREFKPSPLIKLLKVSQTLLRHSAIPIDALVNSRLAYIFAICEENNYINGTGANQPLGVAVASAQGISTSRDVSTDNTTTAMTYDGLINAKFSVKSQYWTNSQWIFHRDGMKQLVKIKDGAGQYIWRESVSADEPDRLLGRPLRLSEYFPNTFTTGLYVGVFGDFSNYWIVDSLSMNVQRLVEKYALRRQVGFLADKETDGMPVLEEAFARVTLA